MSHQKKHTVKPAFFTIKTEQAVKALIPLSCQKIFGMVDFGGALEIGETPIFKKKYFLLYCDKNSSYSVAIKNIFTGEIESIVSVEEHDRTTFKVTDEFKVESKELSSKYARPSLYTHVIPATKFLVKMSYRNRQESDKSLNVRLFKFEITDEIDEPQKLADADFFSEKVKQACLSKGIAEYELVLVTIRIGNSGDDCVFIDWSDKNYSNKPE